MSFAKVAESIASGSFEIAPEVESHPATCVQIIDIGTQEVMSKGEKRMIRQVDIYWELEESEEAGIGPKTKVRDRLTLSFFSSSRLSKLLGQLFPKEVKADGPAAVLDIKLLGMSVLVSVVHNKSGEKTYANINGITKLPASMKPPKYDTEFVKFVIPSPKDKDDWDEAAFKEMSDYYKALIAKSPEFQALHQGKEALDF